MFSGTQVKREWRALLAGHPGLWIRLKGSQVQQFHELLPTACFTLEEGVGEECIHGVFLHLA